MRKSVPGLDIGPSSAVSARISKILKNAKSKKWSGFTLVELIVVITVLAILATIGFLALSGYSQDAKESAMRANVRSIYTAVSSESAVTGNSPRYYVVHDSGAALTGSSTAYVDGNPVALTGWRWDQAGTNYSAGNPDWTKLKLNPEKFKAVVRTFPGFPTRVSAAYDPEVVTLWALDASFVPAGNGKARSSSFFQVAGASPATGQAIVTGNFPMPTVSESSSGAILWLIRSPGGTEPLIDGGKAGVTTACASGSSNGYALPPIQHWGSSMTSKSVISGTGLTIGTKNAAVSCFYGTASLTEVSISCFSGYVEGPTFSCVADACGGTITEANAHSTATSQSVSGNWTRSDAPGLCTWDCNSGFGWDPGTTTCEASVDGTCGTASKTYAFADSSFGSDTLCGNGTPSPARAFPAAGTSVTWTCGGTWKGNASPTCTASRSDPANCSASMQTVNGRTYSVGAFDHGATASADSSSPVTGGTRTYSQTFACSDGAVKTEGTETGPNLTCTAAGYALVGGSCVPNSCNAIKVAYPASADGVYTIDSDGAEAGMTLSAYCDMTTDGGGWTMVAKSVYKPGLTASGWDLFVNNANDAKGDASVFASADTVKMTTANINALIFNGQKKLRYNRYDLSKRWIVEYSAGQALDFTTTKSYNISLTLPTQEGGHVSPFYGSHPHFMLFAGITDNGICTPATGNSRYIYGVWNSTLGTWGSNCNGTVEVWTPYVNWAGCGGNPATCVNNGLDFTLFAK